jgi:hypothetical protein
MLRASKMSEPGARISPCSPAKLQLRIGLQVLGSCKRSILEDRAGSVKLPTNPQERNDERALWAQIALAAFMAETNTDESDALVEFLVGVMHWCDRSGESFEAQLERARSWYSEETSQPEVQLEENVAEGVANTES